MINSFLNLNLAFAIVLVVASFFLIIGILVSTKNFSLNSYLVSNRNVGFFNLTGSLTASALGAWILFGPPTAATWGGFGSVLGYALGTAFPMILLIFFGQKLRKVFPQGRSLTEIVLKKFGVNFFKFIFLLMNFYLFIFLCAEITAISKLTHFISGLSIWISAFIVLFFTLTYVLYGGLKATIKTDAIQFIIIILLFFYLLFTIVLQNNASLNLNLFQQKFIESDIKSLITSFQFGFVFFIAVAATNLFHQGNWQRIYAAKNKITLTKSLLAAFIIIFFIVFFMGLAGSIAKLNNLKFNEDLALFSIILDKKNILVSVFILIFALSLAISTVDTLLNSISSLIIVHKKDFTFSNNQKVKQLSNIVLIFLSLVCFCIVLYQLSVLYLFLLADLLCCACVYVVFKGLYQNKISSFRSFILIIIGLCAGLLFFPDPTFSKSLLIGVLFNKDILSGIFTNTLLFWSFLFSTFLPVFFDLLLKKK